MAKIEDLYEEINPTKFLAANPTYIGQVGEYKFYEHPVYGDEMGCIAVKGEKGWQTDYYELPTLEELEG